ncbi:MAG: hypothetical protein JO001_28055 [Alphaproteobacteria bacterium]|nr:hypothetical protein [Alphaproteobacteria bacterium]
MTDDLTNTQIALLCDIGEYDLSTLTADNRHDVERLLHEGYAAATQDHPASPLQLTAKGIAFLGARGAGLNEA